MVVAVPLNGGWYRAVVNKVLENDQCEVRFVDYGGYQTMSASLFRQIRVDFMTLPFQASECYLADIKPANGKSRISRRDAMSHRTVRAADDGKWTSDATYCFEDLAQGQMLQAYVTAVDEQGCYYVHLYRILGASVCLLLCKYAN